MKSSGCDSSSTAMRCGKMNYFWNFKRSQNSPLNVYRNKSTSSSKSVYYLSNYLFEVQLYQYSLNKFGALGFHEFFWLNQKLSKSVAETR
jgi:hypothetical protein